MYCAPVLTTYSHSLCYSVLCRSSTVFWTLDFFPRSQFIDLNSSWQCSFSLRVCLVCCMVWLWACNRCYISLQRWLHCNGGEMEIRMVGGWEEHKDGRKKIKILLWTYFCYCSVSEISVGVNWHWYFCLLCWGQHPWGRHQYVAQQPTSPWAPAEGGLSMPSRNMLRKKV